MNFYQSPTSTTQINRYALWKYLLMIFILLVMALSALPNLYPKQQIIQLSGTENQLQQLSSQRLHQWLSQEALEVKTIDHQNGKVGITLADPEQNQATISVLEENDHGLIPVIVEQSAAPLWLKKLDATPVKLGLDLSGGVLFVLDVDLQEAFSVKVQQAQDAIKTLLRKNKFRGARVTIDAQQVISIQFLGASDIGVVKSELKGLFPTLTQQNDAEKLRLYYSQEQRLQFHQEVIQQTLNTMRNRIEELGITEAVVQRQGSNRVRIELPGVKDPAEARAIIGATASLDFYQTQTTGGKVFSTADGDQVRVRRTPVFTGDHIQNAQAGRDEMGMPMVNLTLDSIGGKKMRDFSAKNIGKPMVTVFSEYYQNSRGETEKSSEVINIATIRSALGARFSITNLSSPQKANELAMLLRAGSLVAPVTITKEQTINATLGETNIENGLSALILGIALTLAFMALWYKKLGIIANLALLFNMICLFGLMSLLPGAVLTLPGIAGLVLTIGMAVDTNVLIFERIKEEQRRGRSMALAIDQGYKNAFATILDANITTLLTALILYSIGYGPVRGFALTLGLGILTSMFTGVFVSRGLTNLAWRNHSYSKKGKELAA